MRVTLEMFRDIDAALDRFEADPAVALILLEGAGERGLCAGGDIRALYESSRARRRSRQDVLARGIHSQRPHRGSSGNPYVAFMDGIVMGGGVGLVGARPAIAWSPTARNLRCPRSASVSSADVGGTWLLSRSPGEVGTYFGLTGQTMNGPDAIHARFRRCGGAVGRLPALRDALMAFVAARRQVAARSTALRPARPRGPSQRSTADRSLVRA